MNTRSVTAACGTVMSIVTGTTSNLMCSPLKNGI